MADTPNTDNQPHAEPVLVSAQNVRNAQLDKIEKERKDLIHKQLEQGVVDDKNSKNLAKILTNITGVLKGVVPPKNRPTPVGTADQPKTVGDVIKGAVTDVLKGKTDGLKSLITAKGVAGMLAAKYAGDPNSIMGSVFSKVHEHFDNKDKLEQEKRDHFEGFTKGTDIGRAQYQSVYDKKKMEAEAAGKTLSSDELHEATRNDQGLRSSVDNVYKERKEREEKIEDLKAKAATLKSQSGNALKGNKAAFTLSKEENDQLEKLQNEVALVARGVLAIKQNNTVKLQPHKPDPIHEQQEDDARDKAIDVYKKNNNITELDEHHERQFEQEYKANKQAKIDARNKNNKIQIANEAVTEAKNQGAFEKMHGEIKNEAENLNKSSGSQGDVDNDAIEKAREDFYQRIFQEAMDELNKLSKEQLEEMHAIRTAIENDNKNDANREGKQDQSAKDSENKIQKIESDGPDLLKQNALLDRKPIVEKSDKKSGAPETDEKSGGSIIDQLSDLFGGKNKKPNKSGGLWKKASRFLRGGAGAFALGAAAPAALYGATELAQWAQDNPQEALKNIPGAPEKPQSDMSEVEKIKDEGSTFLGIKSSAYSAHEKKWKNRAEQGTQVSPEVAAAVKEKYGIELQIEKSAPPPEKPEITPTKEIIDQKQDAVDQAREEKKTPAPSVVNAPTINNKTTNSNTTITREPIRAEDPNLPWRSAMFS